MPSNNAFIDWSEQSFETQFPEHEKLAFPVQVEKVQDLAHFLDAFVAWLESENKALLCRMSLFFGQFRPIEENIDVLIGKFIGIDPKKFDEETKALNELILTGKLDPEQGLPRVDGGPAVELPPVEEQEDKNG